MCGLVNLGELQDLAGHVAIVTGDAEGIGREIARFLASAGTRAVITGINFSRAKDAAAEIEEAGGKVHALALM